MLIPIESPYATYYRSDYCNTKLTVSRTFSKLLQITVQICAFVRQWGVPL